MAPMCHPQPLQGNFLPGIGHDYPAIFRYGCLATVIAAKIRRRGKGAADGGDGYSYGSGDGNARVPGDEGTRAYY